MTACMCLVQEGQVSAEQEAALRSRMDVFSVEAFDAPPAIAWIAVPEGNGFTAAKPSTSVLVSIQSNRPLPQGERVELLSELCDIWMQETGLGADEVVTVVRDPDSQGEA